MNYIIFVLIIILIQFGLWKLFVKAGRQGWESLIPFYREYVICKVAGRPGWLVALLLIPIINIFVAISIYLDFVKCFGKRSFPEHAGTILLPFVVFPLWGADKSTTFWGASATPAFHEKYPYKKTAAREWADAIIFAVVAATLIRSFLIEAYMIPTGSMERSLLVGDFLFVSKVNYGARIPMTPVAFPFAHHTMPVTGGKAYWEGIKLGYKRLPGFQEIKRNDVVVFNYPVEADEPWNRPVDKRENYIKRAVGIPGDTLSVADAQVYVNGQRGENPPREQLLYDVVTDGTDINPQRILDLRIEAERTGLNSYKMYLTNELAEQIKGWANVQQVKPWIRPSDYTEPDMFPGSEAHQGNQDNFGPLIVPKKGWTVQLDSLTAPLYERAITVYEGNSFEQKGDGYYINGERTDHYTFTFDYYWMMGDNRHNSLDSRFWGFVPEDHIVGKALFVWLSYDKDGTFLSKIRWNRIFMGIK